MATKPNPLVKIELIERKMIRGKAEEKGTKHEVHKGVADYLIAEKSAKLVPPSKQA